MRVRAAVPSHRIVPPAASGWSAAPSASKDAVASRSSSVWRTGRLRRQGSPYVAGAMARGLASIQDLTVGVVFG